MLGGSNRSDPIGQLELGRQFGGRPSRYIQKTNGVAIGATLITFCNIGWDRDGSATYLFA